MQITILLIALSIDVFVASFSCGMGKIKIRLTPAICISSVCSAVLAFSLVVGSIIEHMISDRYTRMLCFWGLFLVGAVKLIEYFLKIYLKKEKQLKKSFSLKIKQLNFVLQIYNDPQSSDIDHSKEMSVLEAFFFAMAMSLDGLFGGIGAAFLDINIPLTILINFAISLILILVGYSMGEKTSARCEKDFGWLSGLLFVFLAFRKLL